MLAWPPTNSPPASLNSPSFRIRPLLMALEPPSWLKRLRESTGDATVRSCISMLPGKLRSVEAPIATAFQPGLFTKTRSPAIGSRPIDQNGSSQLPLVDFVQILTGCATDPIVATLRTTTRNHRLYTLTKPPLLAFDS